MAEEERTTCRDCGASLMPHEVIDGEKILCVGCVVKRLRRHEEHASKLNAVIQDFLDAAYNKSRIDISFITKALLGRGVQLYAVRQTDWYETTVDDVMLEFATGDKYTERLAAYMCGMDIVEFREAYQRSPYSLIPGAKFERKAKEWQNRP